MEVRGMNEHWQARWIWLETPETPSNIYLEARKEIQIEGCVKAANIHISANQEYILYINGNRIGQGPSPCDYRWQYFDTYKIADYLREGSNCIACVCYHIGQCQSTIGYERGPGGLVAQLEIETDQRTFVIGTDATWSMRRSPRWVPNAAQISRWGGFKEIYLAEREEYWMMADYDDSAWSRPSEGAAGGDPSGEFTRLLAREIPYLHREMKKPYEVVRVDHNMGSVVGVEESPTDAERFLLTFDASVPGSFPGALFDFEREVVGYPRLRLQAPEGGVLDIRYGESLDVEHVDTVILKAGLNEWSPFGRRAFRYLKLNFHACPSPIVMESIEMEVVHYPFPEAEAGKFKCSDPLLNQIWELGKYTVLMNSQEHLEDCPWREKALWIVDELIMAKVIYHLYGDTRLVRKSLLQGVRIQMENGAIPATGPEANTAIFPDFCIYWLLAACDYWKVSADASFIVQTHPHMEAVMRWLEDLEGDWELLQPPDEHSFVDWSPHIDRRGKVTALSCLYVKALTEMAHLARNFNWDDCSVRWEAKAMRVKAAIRELCWEPERGLFADSATDEGKSDKYSLQTNYMAVWCGVMNTEEAERFLDVYRHHPALPSIKSPFFQHFVLESMLCYGRMDEAIEVIRSYWGAMLRRGATTIWETFNPESPECTIPHRFQGNTPTYLRDDVPVSHCHGWGASPTYVLMQMLLGIDSINGLQNNVLYFRPSLADVEWAQGSVVIPGGAIEVSWRRNSDNSWECTIVAPAGIRVNIDLTDKSLLPIGSKQVYVNGILH